AGDEGQRRGGGRRTRGGGGGGGRRDGGRRGRPAGRHRAGPDGRSARHLELVAVGELRTAAGRGDRRLVGLRGLPELALPLRHRDGHRHVLACIEGRVHGAGDALQLRRTERPSGITLADVVLLRTELELDDALAVRGGRAVVAARVAVVAGDVGGLALR